MLGIIIWGIMGIPIMPGIMGIPIIAPDMPFDMGDCIIGMGMGMGMGIAVVMVSTSLGSFREDSYPLARNHAMGR
jgi:uncharacterized membrane protein